MKSKHNGLKSLSLTVAFLCMTIIAKTQTVTIAGTQPVNIGCEYQYTATVSNVPSTWTIVDYKWQATFIGPNGKTRHVSSPGPLNGAMYIKPNNCIGNGTETSISFSKEANCWCDGTQPYPYTGNSDPRLCITPPSGCGTSPRRPALGSSNRIETVATKNKVYPNPATGLITIEIKEAGEKSIKIISYSGSTMYQTSTTQQFTKIDISKWPQGIYIVEVTNETKIIIKEKIVVKK